MKTPFREQISLKDSPRMANLAFAGNDEQWF